MTATPTSVDATGTAPTPEDRFRRSLRKRAAFRLNLVGYKLARRRRSLRLAAMFAARAEANTLPPAATQSASILLGGMPRTGKTILARSIRQLGGYQTISTDRFVTYFSQISDASSRLQFRTTFYRTLLARWPTGLVIEGDDFILANKQGNVAVGFPTDITLALSLSKAFHVPFFAIGNSDPDPERRLEAYFNYRERNECWTRDIDTATLGAYARWSIRVSRELRALSQENPFEYIEIPIEDFSRSIERAARQMLASTQEIAARR